MRELLEHYQKFLTIVQKMNKSQLDDLGIIKEELTRALSDGELLKAQLENIELLAKKQAEEIEILKKRYSGLKRARITSLCFAGGGLICTAISFIPGIDNNVRTALFWGGAGLVSTGLVTFSISISIPF